MDTNKKNGSAGADEMNIEPEAGQVTAPAVPAVEQDEEETLVLTFGKPYKFEGETYTEVDLSALEDTSAADLAAVNKILTRKGIMAAMPEMTLDFSIYLAARVAGLPAEFFLGLPSRDTIKLKNLITGFLYGGDGED